MKVKGSICCVECEHIGDWYTIDRVDHADRSGVVRFKDSFLGNFGAFWSSSRLFPFYTIEGDKDEMFGIAEAIYHRGSYSAKRCAVEVDGDRVFLWSPRNYHGFEDYTSVKDSRAEVSYETALALADQIYKDLG